MENQKNNNQEDRPSVSKLLGTAPEQIKRQGQTIDRSGNRADLDEDENPAFKLFIGIASIILVVLGLVALVTWGWITINTPEPTPAPNIVPANFIPTAVSQEVEVSTTTPLASQLSQPTNLPTGSLSQLYITHIKAGQKHLMTTGEFFGRLSGDSVLLADYLGDKFMLGFHHTEDETTPYLLFAVENYESAYGTILNNEAQISRILEPLGFAEGSDFTDAIVANQDVRLLQVDETGLYYALPFQRWLVITSNQETLTTIFNRLR